MVTRLKLLCHAATAATRRSAFPADEPIEPGEQRKLAALAHRLRGADHYLTSPALRATQTATALNLTATPAPDLRDFDYGGWAGRSLAQVGVEEPEAVAEWLRDPTAAPHGGESVAALMDRVAAWLETRNDAPGTTVVVTHASVIRAAVCAALQAGPRSHARIDVAPLTLVRLSGVDGRWTLVSLGPLKAEPTTE